MKSKLFRITVHALFWAAIILFCNSSNYLWQGFRVEDGSLLFPSIYGTLFNAGLVYFNAFYLYPKKLKGHRHYWSMAFLAILMASFVEGLIDYAYTAHIQRMDYHVDDLRNELERMKTALDLKYFPMVILANFTIGNMIAHVVFWCLSFVYILPIQNARERHLQERLRKEKLESELKFLKAQINPHTLFNGINSIYHLIARDPDKAQDVLLRFSDLLRYQIYECSEERLPLSKELHFLENYFNLEKIRRMDNVDIQYTYDINEVENLKIAPLLLFPFVENSFKHLRPSGATLSYIHCTVEVHDDVLHFKLMNSRNVHNEPSDQNNEGVGLKNIKERLGIIYPKKHILKIEKRTHDFLIRLTLDLNENH